MPPARIRFHRLAQQEYIAARRRYAQRSPQTADRFQEAVGAAVEKIAANADRWPLYQAGYRWVRVRKFPYLIYYLIVDDANARVLAVAHAHRRPGYWTRRATRP